MKAFYTLFSIFFFSFALAQNAADDIIYNNYPKGQEDYINGKAGLYKDLHDIFMDKKLKPCENKQELYSVKYIVYPGGTIKFVKDTATSAIEKNRCAYDLIRESFKYLKNWKPAKIDGKEVAAVSSTYIYPDDLFENYKEGYQLSDYFTDYSYKGGREKMIKDLYGGMEFSRFKITRGGSVIITFIIDTDGRIKDVDLQEGTENPELDDMIKRAVPRKGWTPSKIHGIPMRTFVRLPLTFRL